MWYVIDGANRIRKEGVVSGHRLEPCRIRSKMKYAPKGATVIDASSIGDSAVLARLAGKTLERQG